MYVDVGDDCRSATHISSSVISHICIILYVYVCLCIQYHMLSSYVQTNVCDRYLFYSTARALTDILKLNIRNKSKENNLLMCICKRCGGGGVWKTNIF